MSDLIHQGYLYKESKHLKVFRKRWIVLKDTHLYSYKHKPSTQSSQTYTDTIDLTRFKHISLQTQKIHNDTLKFELISKHETRRFIAPSVQSFTTWVNHIQRAINHTHTPIQPITEGQTEGGTTITNTTQTPPKKVKKASKSEIHITAYWEGYTEQDQSYPLNEVPEHVNTIPIAFIQPVKDPNSGSDLATTWAFDDQFVYKKEDIKQWIAEINARGLGQRVLLSILDTPTCHWYPDVDIDAFAKNIARDCDEWGIAGVDVDAESGMADASEKYVETFVSMIKALRKYLSKGKIITYTCYTESQWDSDIIGQCKGEIEYINTMAYWGGTQSQIALYDHYVNDIGDGSKVGIGVKAGKGGDSTSLDTVKGCAEWFRDNDDINVKRMMLWSLTRDVKEITQEVNGTFLETIYENISPKPDSQIKEALKCIKDSPLQIASNGGDINVIQNITVNNYNTSCVIM